MASDQARHSHIIDPAANAASSPMPTAFSARGWAPNSRAANALPTCLDGHLPAVLGSHSAPNVPVLVPVTKASPMFSLSHALTSFTKESTQHNSGQFLDKVLQAVGPSPQSTTVSTPKPADGYEWHGFLNTSPAQMLSYAETPVRQASSNQGITRSQEVTWPATWDRRPASDPAASKAWQTLQGGSQGSSGHLQPAQGSTSPPSPSSPFRRSKSLLALRVHTLTSNSLRRLTQDMYAEPGSRPLMKAVSDGMGMVDPLSARLLMLSAASDSSRGSSNRGQHPNSIARTARQPGIRHYPSLEHHEHGGNSRQLPQPYRRPSKLSRSACVAQPSLPDGSTPATHEQSAATPHEEAGKQSEPAHVSRYQLALAVVVLTMAALLGLNTFLLLRAVQLVHTLATAHQTNPHHTID